MDNFKPSPARVLSGIKSTNTFEDTSKDISPGDISSGQLIELPGGLNDKIASTSFITNTSEQLNNVIESFTNSKEPSDKKV